LRVCARCRDRDGQRKTKTQRVRGDANSFY
jgi:hypothetical protein